MRLLAALVALSLVAAACGGDDDDDAGGGDDASADVDEEGVLHMTTGLTPNTTQVQYDLSKVQSAPSEIHMLIYDTLLRAQMDGSYEPGIATKAEVMDPMTLVVTVREGVKFSNGTPLTPEDVRSSIIRRRDAKNGAYAAELQEVSDATVAGQDVTIKLKTPVAGTFYPLLGRGETMVESKAVVESGADQLTKPVGAGPYVLESLTIESKLVLKRNPNYFQVDQIRIPTVEYTHVALDPQAVVNALRSGSADAANNLQKEQIAGLQGTELTTRISTSDSTLLWGQICKRNPPLNNVKVRQALNFALDREQLIDVIYEGESEPQWGFWTEEHPFHNPDMTDYYKRDVRKAKTLLTEAGYPNGFTMGTVSQPGIVQTAAEIIKANWAEIGVTVNLVPVTNIVQEFFTDNKMEMYFFPLQRSGLDKVTRNLVPGSIGNVCTWNDPALNALVAELRALPQDTGNDETVDKWHELEELTVTQAHNIFGVFGTSSNTYNEDRIGDVEFIPNFQGISYLDIRDAYIKG
jgi:peptide/nickel transport system substrate-binding protein